ncbi:MAG TPA: type VI secretion system tube protein Hcp [Sedimenticola sp.]|nr:type VI secretion system tube protein Hcp [Sedimenticola sp.]
MAFDAFLKIEGIDGESTDDKHRDWIEILSYNHGVSQPVSSASATGGRTGGRADFQDFSIVKTADKATPDLNLFCANGKHIPKVELELCLATEDKHTFMKYTLEDVIVSSVSIGGGGGEDRPTESVTFSYGKIKWEYTPIDQTGKAGSATDRTWDLEANKQA